METSTTNESGQSASGAVSVDRALTVGGYVHDQHGQYKESTRRLYGHAWQQFSIWCRERWISSLPATPETVALYAQDLLQDGYVVGTIRSRITAIHARHRQTGHPVPDNVPAWIVLRDAESGRVRPEVEPIGRTNLIAAITKCDLSRSMGVRDRALTILAWDLLIPAPACIGLNIADVDIHDDADSSIRVGTRQIPIVHDHDPAIMCAVCATRDWINAMADVGITHGPLFRPVDRFDVIAGRVGGPRRCGSTQPGGRLTVRSMHRVWARLVARSGIRVCTQRALRLGGARHRIKHGEPLAEVLDRASWSPRTPSVVSRLVAPD